MASFPPDQFDELPAGLDRVGAHRAPPKPGRGWVTFAWAALATGVLVLAGLFGLSRLVPGVNFNLGGTGSSASAAPSASGTPTAAAVTDPTKVDPALGLSITVLNGTSTAGLADKAGDEIKSAGWPDPARASSTSTNVTTTVIYYTDAKFEGIARGLAILLGAGADVQLSDAFPASSVTIVLGKDFTPVG